MVPDILQAILVGIMDNGLNIGRWTLDQDVSGDFRIVDNCRRGSYRYPRTASKLLVNTD